MYESTVVLRLPRVLVHLKARSTPALDAAAVAARNLARYYAPLEREQPGTLISRTGACLVRDALPDLRAARRMAPGATLADPVETHARSADASVYEVDVPALVERLRVLALVQRTAVIDLAERMDAVLRGDFDGRERVRQEFGIIDG